MEMLDLLNSLEDISAERNPRDPKKELIGSSNIDSYRKIDELKPPPYEFEKRVITFLWDNRDRYRIDKLIRFQNSSVDGAIETKNVSIPFEIKYRMNWLKACQAMWQFNQYRALSKTAFKTGIVFFHSFSADWARSPRSSPIPNGWRNWYSDHARSSETMTVHLVRLEDGRLETYKELRESQQSNAKR
ncbi:MAG TPA: hypothetical protein PLK77_00250 [Pyrinomonadaceae bacterium]|nr:hypothetical protein [Pyrinomonadaceae bacterium]